MIANPSRYWWGEGDEKFFVDGERFPSTFGTVTEDYFGYAWADPNAFSSPYHAQPQCDGPENFGYTCLDRFHVHDMVPFQTSFLFDLEIWHWRDVYMDYATTAFWYGRPEAPSGLPPVPDDDFRTVDRIEPERVLMVKNAIEGELMKIRSVSKGKTEGPFVGRYSQWKWSNDKQLFWHGAGPGDTVTLEVPVKGSGRYTLEAVFTKARDYGIVQVSLDGKKMGTPVDLYSPHVVIPTTRICLGDIDLKASTVLMSLEITGKNPKAVNKYSVGLDYVRLIRKL